MGIMLSHSVHISYLVASVSLVKVFGRATWLSAASATRTAVRPSVTLVIDAVA